MSSPFPDELEVKQDLNMKTKAILAGLVIAVLNGLMFVEMMAPHKVYLLAGSIALAVWLVLKAMLEKPADAPEAPEPIIIEKEAPPAPKNAAEAEVIAVLASLQSKGRLVDFLMDDISKYSDAQVGAAARVVHQGCKAAFGEMFTVEPVSAEAEGSVVTVPDNPGDAYRFTGAACGGLQQSGKLVHKGWKASKVNLPRVLNVEEGTLPTIAPAQIEVK